MAGMMYLLIAIIAEVIGTTALKSSNGFSNLFPSIIVVVSYVLSFFLLGMSLKTIPLGIGYALWSGIGTALTIIIGVVVWKEAMSLASVLGILLILSGVVILNMNKVGIG
ncbi:DMT family transporter [Virgibacillus ihumii]|uniref:DMT family transporter n=1 Tax=Virgibacillus ihumii TaxID=2686091 RepID=UPI00157D6624|nr:multidrug efflux SMR transporter [Virgibacillus ihumii]